MGDELNGKEPVTLQDMKTHLFYIRRDINEIKERMDDHYVTKEEFAPIKRLVYTVSAAMIVGVIGMFFSMVR